MISSLSGRLLKFGQQLTLRLATVEYLAKEMLVHGSISNSWLVPWLKDL